MTLASPLEIRLLGQIDIRHGQAVKFPYAKVLALLAYLVLEPGRQRRERITGLLWPTQDEAIARANLRSAIHALRKQLGEARIGGDREHVWFACGSPDHVDTVLLEAPTVIELTPDAAHGLLDRLLACAGELMPGFVLADASEFGDWLDIQRMRCHRQWLEVSERLARHPSLVGDRGRLIALARAQTLIDPWHEGFHLRLLRLLADDGQNATALAHFDYMRGLLWRELEATPSPEARALVERLGAQLPQAVVVDEVSAAPARLGNGLRPVALLFVDIRSLGSDDREKLAALTRARALISEEARRRGAHVCPTADGGVLAYFGFPDGLPRTAAQAMSTALGLLRRADLAQVRLRCGLHWGGMILSAQPGFPDALGEISDMAIKLAQWAGPGEVLATAAFVRKVALKNPLALERMPEIYPYGRVEAYRIDDARKALLRGEAPLVDRKTECGKLLKLWRALRHGRLQAAVLAGPPGCGKSRLVRWLAATVDDPNRVMVLECRQTRAEAPYYPIAELLRSRCGILAGDRLESRRLKFERGIARQHPQLDAAQRQMVGWLAGLPLDDTSLSPAARRKCLHDALRSMLAKLAVHGPLLLAVEDLHWADPSTTLLIESLIDDARDLPCLILISARPPLADTWRPELPRVVPGPLPPAAGRDLALSLLGKDAGEDIITNILARAQGSPLFIETLALSAPIHGMEHRGGDLADDILAAVASDPLQRQIALGAAVLGEEFDLDLLRAMFADAGDADFHAALRAIEHHGLMVPRVASHGRFHHALIRDACHDSASPGERRTMHRRALDASTRTVGAEATPHWLAWHAERAGDLPTAVDHLTRAAWQDATMGAHAEAIRHFKAARSLLERLPASRANEQAILRLLLGEGKNTVALCGYGASETRAVFSQVLARGDPESDRDTIFLAQYGLWLGGSSHSGYQQTMTYVDKLRRTATASGSLLHRMQTAYAHGNTTLWLGELAVARSKLEEAVALYETARPANLLDDFHEDTGVISLALLAWVAWLQGDAAQADVARERAIELARALNHPFSLCFALSCAARLDIMRGAVAQVRGLAEELLALASRQSFAIWEATADVMLGWIRCVEGDAAGLDQIDRGLAFTALAMSALEGTFLSMRADALYRLNQPARCIDAVDETLTRCERRQDRYMVAELLRLHAHCAAATGDATGAAAQRAAARDMAQRQGARAFLDRIDAD